MPSGRAAVVVLLLAFAFATVLGHPSESASGQAPAGHVSAVEAIIRKHHAIHLRHIEELGPLDDFELEMIQSRPKMHTCAHDDPEQHNDELNLQLLDQLLDIEYFRADRKASIDAALERARADNPALSADDEEALAEQHKTLHSRQAGCEPVETTFAPIRVNVDFDLLQLDADLPWACYDTTGRYEDLLVGSSSSSGYYTYSHTYDNVTTRSRLCEPWNYISAGVRTTVTDTTNAAVEILESFLRVQRYTKPLNNAGVPSCTAGISTSGLSASNTDYQLYVTARPVYQANNASSGTTLAYAAACIIDTCQIRPIIGFANANPRAFRPASIWGDFDSLTRTMLHELSHALGFSSYFFPYWYDSRTGEPWSKGVNGNPDNTYTFIGANNIQRAAVRTGHVVSFARCQYDCKNAQGFELENAGGSGTAGSHWEQRVSGNELMSGTMLAEAPLSGLTLGAFADMGPYDVDFSVAEPLAWGENLGCGFFNETCSTGWPDSYFCTDENSFGCTADALRLAPCNLFDYSTIGQQVPSAFRYFPSRPTYAGDFVPIDYCPTFVSYGEPSTALCSSPSPFGAGSLAGGQFNIASSRCFAISGASANSFGVSCYKTSCSAGTLTVTAFGTDFTCPDKGGPIDITVGANSMTLVCPPAEIICPPATLPCPGLPPAINTAKSSPASLLLSSGIIGLIIVALLCAL